jgi:hypothetical protein
MKKLRFLIAAPPYNHQSGGVMILHNLCDMLNRQGYEAAIVIFHNGKHPHFQWVIHNSPGLYCPTHQRVHLSMEDSDQAVRDFLEDGVLVYPDVAPGNPLAAKRVVTYLLGPNHGYAPQYPNEYVLSFSKLFHDNPNSYLFNPFHDDALHSTGARHWSERTMDLTYFGKGQDAVDCFRIPETLMISRTWPEDKNQLGIILRQCRYFFTWDSLTATNKDAVSCGAVPVILHEHQMTRMESGRGELGILPEVRLEDYQNKESVIGDRAKIDQQMLDMNNNILFYQDTWPERVSAFARDVHRFYGY